MKVQAPQGVYPLCAPTSRRRCNRRLGTGLHPADFQAAYDLPATKGGGQIVAIVDAFDNPNIASDLKTYRSEFGLPAANFTKYNQKGQKKHYPSPDANWGLEEDLDVEMVSASCPKCTIYLIEANSDELRRSRRSRSRGREAGSSHRSEQLGRKLQRQLRVRLRLRHSGRRLSCLGRRRRLRNDFPSQFGSVVAIGGTSLAGTKA